MEQVTKVATSMRYTLTAELVFIITRYAALSAGTLYFVDSLPVRSLLALAVMFAALMTVSRHALIDCIVRSIADTIQLEDVSVKAIVAKSRLEVLVHSTIGIVTRVGLPLILLGVLSYAASAQRLLEVLCVAVVVHAGSMVVKVIADRFFN